MHIKLSKDPLNTSDIGYQAPIDQRLVQEPWLPFTHEARRGLADQNGFAEGLQGRCRGGDGGSGQEGCEGSRGSGGAGEQTRGIAVSKEK